MAQFIGMNTNQQDSWYVLVEQLRNANLLGSKPVCLFAIHSCSADLSFFHLN